MKKLIFLLTMLLMVSATFAQVQNVAEYRIINTTTPFGRSLSIGTKLYCVSDSAYYVVSAFISGTESISTSAGSLWQLNGIAAETDPFYTASTWYTTTNNSEQWNIAYGWGDHPTTVSSFANDAGYLERVDTLDSDIITNNWDAFINSHISIPASENKDVQSLSGTSVTWDMNYGLNAKITLSGATTITISNCPEGSWGTIRVTNGGNVTYRITFSGYSNFDISDAVYYSGNTVVVSGGTYIDIYSWKNMGDGNILISGILNLK